MYTQNSSVQTVFCFSWKVMISQKILPLSVRPEMHHKLTWPSGIRGEIAENYFFLRTIQSSRNLFHAKCQQHQKHKIAFHKILEFHILSEWVILSRALHGQAAPSATFYVVSILSFYLFGLAMILVHYMNSYYGAWNWSLSDAWLEVKPAFKVSQIPNRRFH